MLPSFLTPRIRPIPIRIHKRYRHSRDKRKAQTFFPHGFSATEPLVPPSEDGSTPLTDALPRSPLLDPTTYEPKKRYREPPPTKTLEGKEQLTDFENLILNNPFGMGNFYDN
jgi:hypothetical protein